VPAKQLPFAPIPQPGELLSSWIERIGLFYGIGYLGARAFVEPRRTSNEHGINDDLDSSALVRANAIAWTGIPQRLAPEVLVDRDEGTLEVSARLAYCPECWNQDVENGHSPFVRRSWAHWVSVMCSVHRRWLNAREPHRGIGVEVNGWAVIWQSNYRWARAANVIFDPNWGSLALGFDSQAMAAPGCAWSDLELEFESLGRVPGLAILAKVTLPEYVGVRSRIGEALEIGEPARQITDAHLRGYNHSRPGWIVARISSLVAATEILRILDSREALFEQVRKAMHGHAASRQLIDDCRAIQYGLTGKIRQRNATFATRKRGSTIIQT
jgi:hypothetical protein